MKKIDFTRTGGMPVTQNVLDYMQSAYNEQISAIVKTLFLPGTSVQTASPLVPVVLWGMYEVFPGIEAGAFYYNNEIVLWNSQNIPALGPNKELAIQIQQSSTALTLPFNDGSMPPVKIDKAGVFVLQDIGTPATTTQFPYSAFTSLGYAFGLNCRESAFTTMSLGTVGASGALSYKKNFLTNCLHITGSMNVSSASIPPVYSQCGVLPSQYCPNSPVPFTAYFRYHQSTLKETTDIDYLRTVNGEVGPDGSFTLGLISASATYTIYWNTIIQLD